MPSASLSQSLRRLGLLIVCCLGLGLCPSPARAQPTLPSELAGRWQPAARTAKINRALPASALHAKPRLTVTPAGRVTLRIRRKGRYTARVRKGKGHTLVITVRKRRIRVHYRLQYRRLKLTFNRQSITLQKM
ncbi:hypothetical protein [Pseudoramibacter faecis]|uniref:hypothetical protein n=1 Tax=Pseudoramibacter faecis TaxID=3108534 RepID=UPI002E7AADF3|nr:hypothetical protein [Pseudoramibacter sp. HA2172]